MASSSAPSDLAYFTTTLAVYDVVEEWMVYDAMLCLGLLRRQEKGAPLTLAVLLSDDAGSFEYLLADVLDSSAVVPESLSLWEAVLASPRLSRLHWKAGSSSVSESLISVADLTEYDLPSL